MKLHTNSVESSIRQANKQAGYEYPAKHYNKQGNQFYDKAFCLIMRFKVVLNKDA